MNISFILLLLLSDVLSTKYYYKNDVVSMTGNVAFSSFFNCTPTEGFLDYHSTQTFQCKNCNNTLLFISVIEQFPHFIFYFCQPSPPIYHYNISDC